MERCTERECATAKALKSAVKGAGGLIYKLRFEGGADCPDYLIIYKGLHLVETKRPFNDARESQDYVFQKIAIQAGEPVWVVSTQEQAKALIKKWSSENDANRI